jgi:hypothetical protein
MAYFTSFEASNSADWTIEISATDVETGEDIDFTGADVTLAVRDDSSQRLLATIGNGIDLLEPTVLTVSFSKESLAQISAGSYRIGAVYEINGETNQLFVGTFSVYDGVVSV